MEDRPLKPGMMGIRDLVDASRKMISIPKVGAPTAPEPDDVTIQPAPVGSPTVVQSLPTAPDVHLVRCRQCGKEWQSAKADPERTEMCTMCKAIAADTVHVPRPEHLRPAEIYDTKANPRIKWSCARCTKRNDEALTIPIGAVEVKFCKFCRCRVTFTLKPTRPAAKEGEAG